MKYSRNPTISQKDNYDVTSIPGFVIKKNSSRGVKHGPSERQKMYYQARQMLKKARQKKHGRHPTILSRWYADEEYRKSLAAHNIGEQQIMLFDRIALEKHHYTATKTERIQNTKHWVLYLTADGPQKPLNQRPEFARAIKECKRLQDAHLARPSKVVDPSIPANKFDKEKNNNSKAVKTSTKLLTQKKRDGDTINCRGETCRQRRPHRRTGLKPTGRRAIGIRSILQDLTIGGNLFLSVVDGFGCLEKNLQPIDGSGGGKQYTHKHSTYRAAQHNHANTRGSSHHGSSASCISSLGLKNSVVICASCLTLRCHTCL